MNAVVAAFNQEKALVGAFSVITNLRMELFQALVSSYLARRRVPAQLGVGGAAGGGAEVAAAAPGAAQTTAAQHASLGLAHRRRAPQHNSF